MHSRLMLGFMVTTFMLSMWLSNAATATMILPIVEAVFEELYSEINGKGNEEENIDMAVEKTHKLPITKEKNGDEIEGEMAYTNEAYSEEDQIPDGSAEFKEVKIDIEPREDTDVSKERDLIIKGLTICVPYASCLGGMATLTGTLANLVLPGQFELFFPSSTTEVSFGLWTSYCLPQAIVLLFLSYLWLSIWFLGFNPREMAPWCFKKMEKTEKEVQAEEVIKNKYKEMGSMKWEEVTVLAIFTLTAILWLFRSPGFVAGWGEVFPKGFISDGTVAMFMSFWLFILPKREPECLQKLRGRPISQGKRSCKPVPAILDWGVIKNKFPWGVALLFGSGFAISQSARTSGLSIWLGEQMIVLKELDDWVVVLVMTSFICVMTETTSNVAIASLFIPIMAEMAKSLEIHPLYIMTPAVLAASFSFMLPISSPTIAIAFTYDRVSVWDMVKAGWVLKVLGILTTTIFINTYGMFLLDLDQFPDWTNVTEIHSTVPTSYNATIETWITEVTSDLM